jgi:GT2 family glycosyltransferase
MKVGIHGMGRLSLIVPTYSINDSLTKMAVDCVKSYKNQVDEVVISEDSGIYREELYELADIYVLHPNVGYSKNTNMAWKVATGDFALVVNSDTTLQEGSLGDLCIANTVASPLMIENSSHASGNISGACFCVGRNIFQDGMFDEHTTVFNGADTVLFNNYWNRGVKSMVVSTVKVVHISGTPGPSLRAHK